MSTEKILGQSNPSITTETQLYSSICTGGVVCTALNVCNRSTSAVTFRVSVSNTTGATDVKDYLFYGYPLDANESIRHQNLRWTLSSGNTIRVYSDSSSLSFNLFGSEND